LPLQLRQDHEGWTADGSHRRAFLRIGQAESPASFVDLRPVQTDHLAAAATGEGEQSDRGYGRRIHPILGCRIEGGA
jgi:hypothetical protein